MTNTTEEHNVKKKKISEEYISFSHFLHTWQKVPYHISEITICMFSKMNFKHRINIFAYFFPFAYLVKWFLNTMTLKLMLFT
jgi:hypothetical protein